MLEINIKRYLKITHIFPGAMDLTLIISIRYCGYLMQRTDSLEKTLILGKTEQEKRTTEDEMAGWHHRCNEHELGQALEDGEGQGSLCAAVHGVTKSWTRLSD